MDNNFLCIYSLYTVKFFFTKVENAIIFLTGVILPFTWNKISLKASDDLPHHSVYHPTGTSRENSHTLQRWLRISSKEKQSTSVNGKKGECYQYKSLVEKRAVLRAVCLTYNCLTGSAPSPTWHLQQELSILYKQGFVFQERT